MYNEYNLLPKDKVEKHIYRMLLLMSDHFQLTRIEKRELVFYASRFEPISPKGGRGKSKERVYAFLCLYLLRRDNRQSVICKIWDRISEIYKLDNKDKSEIEEFVLKEVDRINKTFLTVRGLFQVQKRLGKESFEKEQLDIIRNKSKTLRSRSPQICVNIFPA